MKTKEELKEVVGGATSDWIVIDPNENKNVDIKNHGYYKIWSHVQSNNNNK